MTEEKKTIFVCCACGKQSNDHYGNDPISQGWDASCVLNALKVYEEGLPRNNAGLVVGIPKENIVHA